MDKLVIRGGNPLVGTIRVSGAKNAALPAMAAALLTDEPVILENIPQVRDIETERKLLASMGAEVSPRQGRANDRITISCRTLSDPVARYEIVKTMRASSLVLGPLMHGGGQWLTLIALLGGNRAVVYTERHFDAARVLDLAVSDHANAVPLLADTGVTATVAHPVTVPEGGWATWPLVAAAITATCTFGLACLVGRRRRSALGVRA